MTDYTQMRRDQLERKLQFQLGSKKNWLTLYGEWLAENGCTPEEAYDDHNVLVFVKSIRGC